MQDIKSSDAYNKTYVLMLNFLSYKPRSEKEIRDRLKKFRVSSEVKEVVFSDIEAEGFIDDVRFAQMYVDGIKGSGKAKSSRQLRNFLYKKGISSGVIDVALSSFDKGVEELSATKDCQKKLNLLKSKKDISPAILRQKLIKFLMTKGYSSDVVFTVVDTLTMLK